MQLKSLWLALTLFNFLWLVAANADVHQNNGRPKVLPGKRLPDDLGTERDKSSGKMRKIFPQADEENGELRLRHEQHHLRQQQHLMAWEQRLQLQLQQHLREQQESPAPESEPVSVPVPVRHHQHKSLANPKPGTAKKPIRQASSRPDDKAKILVKRRLHYNEYDNDDLELHFMDSAEEEGRVVSPEEWHRIGIAHRRQKEQHQLQLLAERQQQRQLLTTTTTTTTTTTEPNNAQSEDNDVSASEGTRFNGLKPKQAVCLSGQ